jgi:hypothetical protein
MRPKIRIFFLKLVLTYMYVERSNYYRAHRTLEGKRIYSMTGPHYHPMPFKQFIISTMSFIAGWREQKKSK